MLVIVVVLAIGATWYFKSTPDVFSEYKKIRIVKNSAGKKVELLPPGTYKVEGPPGFFHYVDSPHKAEMLEELEKEKKVMKEGRLTQVQIKEQK